MKTLVFGLLLACPMMRLAGQVALHASAGLRYSTTLVHDSIVTGFDVRPSLAPVITVTAGLPLNPPWTADLLLDVGSSVVRRHDRNGTSVAITRATTLSFGVLLRRDLRHGFSAAAGAGLLKYIPSERVGIFRDGSPIFATGQAAATYEPPVAARHGLALEARYDLHGFLTPALRQEGFVNSRLVHRVSLGVRYRLRAAGGGPG